MLAPPDVPERTRAYPTILEHTRLLPNVTKRLSMLPNYTRNLPISTESLKYRRTSSIAIGHRARRWCVKSEAPDHNPPRSSPGHRNPAISPDRFTDTPVPPGPWIPPWTRLRGWDAKTQIPLSVPLPIRMWLDSDRLTCSPDETLRWTYRRPPPPPPPPPTPRGTRLQHQL